MARSKFKRKGKAKFIMIDAYIIRSAAWQALTANDRATYLELKWRYDGLNNGRIGLGERELAASLHFGRDTGRRSLKNLVEKGFAVKSKASGFNVKSRMATEWRLTEYACDVTGELPTKDFMRWPEENPQAHLRSAQAHLRSSQRAGNDRKGADRRISRPVKANSDDPQAHLRSTYNTTMGGTTDAA
ncbi:hypothetical protein GTW25_05835 [Aliihoeflea aestuarii]|jgi:hypothetical protein|uniref:GntR family transcriptional regulator n=1 Tax=Aliihoeflea aestuarii TaxID=453840 RepID=UPI00209237F9|nr:GntR family transcriptional regulator [Aliihoeflea aestuarii]MCO6390546.1 hypothetical protein [Aliihoeflea aestuarii]